MEYIKEIYESEYGYGYKIYVDGKLTIIQPHAPGVPGLKGMTISEANKYADEAIERMIKTPAEMPENEWAPDDTMFVTRDNDDVPSSGVMGIDPKTD